MKYINWRRRDIGPINTKQNHTINK